MAHIQWARSSQFNWVYDNLGGTPLMAAVAGQAERFGDLLKKTERAVNGIQLELYRRLGSGVLPADQTAA